MTATVVAARLRELLDYDSTTGVFKWRSANSRRVTLGSTAGTLQSNGYIRIRIDGVAWHAHRLAWLHFYGAWPSQELDHINRVRHDNRIANLREATRSQNEQNKLLQANNTSGFKGVSWHARDGRWHARISTNGKRMHLGAYDTPDAAYAAYCAAMFAMQIRSPLREPSPA